MSLKEDIKKNIENPPILNTDSKNPYIEIKSRIDNIHELLKKIADEVDRINSKLSKRGF
jgi:hypothetical protein